MHIPAMLDIIKALDSTSASGQALIPEVVNPHIAELAMAINPLRNLIPRTPWFSRTYDRDKRLTFGRAKHVGDGQTRSASQSTYARFAESLKLMQIKGGASGFLEFSAQKLVDPLQSEIDGHTLAATFEEEAITMYGNRYADSYQHNGLDTWIETNLFLSSALIGFAILDSMIDAVRNKGSVPKAFIMSFKMLSKLSAILQVGQQFNDKVVIQGGFRLQTYRGIPIYDTSFIAANQAWPGGAMTATKSAGGSLADDQYFYRVAAVLTTGETLACTEANATTSAADNSVTIAWDASGLPNTVRKYKIYRGLTTGVLTLYTEIPAYVYQETGDILNTVNEALVDTWIDNGQRVTMTTDYATTTVTGAAFTPGTNQATQAPLSANGEDIYLISTMAPGKVEGPACEQVVGKELQMLPLAKLTDRDEFMLLQYSTLVMVEQFSAKARDVLLLTP